ncbi:MAG TPA: GNAT family N-acetyltransferase [Thermoanaerobaculia bacterium]|nr:GNAT family N-acetyltransferase [Thermoanaerobaculia bacterium]
MNLRPAAPSDAAEWLRMRTALWPVEGHEAEIAEYFESGGSVLLTRVLVAERPSRGLAGFIELGLRTYAEGCDSSPVPFIEGWYVDADVRRTGVGAALVRAAEEWARQQGYREIASDVELENETSLSAHRALGYQEVERLVCFRRSLECGGTATAFKSGSE